MMFHAPNLGLPYYNRYTRYGYRYPYSPYRSYFSRTNSNSFNSSSNYFVNRDNNLYGSSNKDIGKDTNNRINDSSDSPLFQLFGINLYFDDILLICLIWFLYDEGVKDEGLFIALILLLLS